MTANPSPSAGPDIVDDLNEMLEWAMHRSFRCREDYPGVTERYERLVKLLDELRNRRAQPASADREALAAIVEGYTDILSPATARKVADRIRGARIPAASAGTEHPPGRCVAWADGCPVCGDHLPSRQGRDTETVEKAREILADYDAGRPLEVAGDGWLVRFAAIVAKDSK